VVWGVFGAPGGVRSTRRAVDVSRRDGSAARAA